jgi:hypothetical protein
MLSFGGCRVVKRILIKSAVCYLSVLGFELPIIYGLRAPIPTQMALGLISFVFGL